MGDLNADKLAQKANDGSFGFGFNDVDFSDRILRLEIIPNDSECGNDFKVQTLHINSLILAAKSPFFFKLFKNGMRESQKRNEVTVRIDASEEVALMDVLNFMYGNPLRATSAADLVDVLIVADKFEVTTCVECCIQLLLKLPMSLESAPFYLEIPSSVLVAKDAQVVQPLIDAAKKYLAAHFRDFTKSEEVMALPLSVLEALLGTDGLQVSSEDDVFYTIVKWARVHYPKLEERREILTNRLAHFICFPYMTCSKLMEVVDYPDFDYDQVSKLVLNACSSKIEATYGQHLLTSTTKCCLPRRVYTVRLIKVVNFELPQPCCVVYLDLKKEECEDLFPSNSLDTQAFCLGRRDFLLMAQSTIVEKKSCRYFGLYVVMKGSESCTLDCEFAVRKKPSMKFQTEFPISNCTFTSTQKAWGRWLYKWTDFMSDESVYFIDGILHLRAQITLCM